MQKFNLNKIIADNLDKAKFQSKKQPSLPGKFNTGGIYLSDKAKATQFGEYKTGGTTGDPNQPYHPITNPEGYKQTISPLTIIANAQKLPIRKPYQPSQAVNNAKAILSGTDLATGFSGNPFVQGANYLARISNATGDAYTAARYAMDGQWGNAGVDAGEALLDLIPFRKGKNVINLSKTNGLPGTYNKLSKLDKSLNNALKVGKAGASADDFMHSTLGKFLFGDPNSNVQYANGGQPKPKYKQWLKTVNPDFISNDYNLKDAYNELPYLVMQAWAKDPRNNHLPDTYKLPNHESFSNQSKYYDSYTPGVGGYWGEGEENFIKNPKIGPPIPSASWMGQYKKGGGYFPEYHSWAPPRMDEGGDCPCPEYNCKCPEGYERLGNATLVKQLDSINGLSAMQPFYDDLYAAANKYGKDGHVSGFNAARAVAKSFIKHPNVLFMKRHLLPGNVGDANPYGVEGFTSGKRNRPWQPSEWAEPLKERAHPIQNWLEKIRFENEDNKMRRRGMRDAGKTGCWGANCYDNEIQDQAEYGGSLNQYAPGGVTTETTQPPFVFPSARDLQRQMMNKSDVTGTSIQEKQKQDAIAQEIHRRNEATAKRQFISQGKKSTPESEARRIRLNQQYASQLPNAQIDEQGNISRVNLDRSVTGEAENFMSRREDKAGEHALGALEAAGYVEGLGALGSAAKKAVAKSMESGLLSNTYKLNPWAFKTNPEAAYRGIGKAGYEDLLTSGEVKSFKQNAYPEPYFMKGSAGFDKGDPNLENYAKGYMIELGPKEPMKGVGVFENYNEDLIGTPVNKITIDNPNLKLLKKDWLRRYKEIPKNMESKNLFGIFRGKKPPVEINPEDQLKIVKGNYLKSELPKNYILESDINKSVDREKKWLQSDEYLKRRSAETGETADEIKKDVNNILKNWETTEIVSEKSKGKNVLGTYNKYKDGTSKIKIDPNLSREEALATLDHEIKHGFSESSTTNNYKKYPTTKIGNTLSNLLKPEFNSYLREGAEQQVRALRLLDFIEDKYGIPRGKKLSIEDVNRLADNINLGGIYEEDFANNYSDVFHQLYGMKQADQKLKFVPNNLLKVKFPFEYQSQGNGRQNILNYLNRAYAVPAGILVGGAALNKEKYGGLIEADSGVEVPPTSPIKPGTISQVVREMMAAENAPVASPVASAEPVAQPIGPENQYMGTSIVDYLATKGYPGTKTFRKQLAKQYGVENYDFSGSKNLELLNKLRQNDDLLEQTQPSFNPVSIEKMMQMEQEAATPKVVQQPRQNIAPVVKKKTVRQTEEVEEPSAPATTNPLAGYASPLARGKMLANFRTPAAAPQPFNSQAWANNPLNPVSVISKFPAAAPVVKKQQPIVKKQQPSKTGTQSFNENAWAKNPINPLSIVPAFKKVNKQTEVQESDPIKKKQKPISNDIEMSDILGVFSGNPSLAIKLGDKLANNETFQDAKSIFEERGISGLWDAYQNKSARDKGLAKGDDSTAITNFTLPVVNPNVKDSLPPPVVFGKQVVDTDRGDNNFYHAPIYVDLNRAKFGFKNRGGKPSTEQNGVTETAGLVLTPFAAEYGSASKARNSASDDFLGTNTIRKYKDSEIKDDNIYGGIDDQGNFQLGYGKDMKGKNLTMSDFRAVDTEGFVKDSKGNYKLGTETGNKKTSKVPHIKTDQGESHLPFLVPNAGKDQDKTYGQNTGGKIVIATPDFKEKILVGGSLSDVDKALEEFKAKHKLSKVKLIVLDNGTYSRGFMKKGNKISSADWKKYEVNSSGGAGFYLKGQGYKMGGSVNIGDEMDVTDEDIEQLKKQGYKFDII